MRFIFSPHKRSQQHHFLAFRTFKDTTYSYISDSGLDHTVKRERNLKTLLNVKNFIRKEPSKSLPTSIITERRKLLKIPIHPMDFIRKYPSVFEEFIPDGSGIHPHIRLTPEVLNLDAEEHLMYQSETYRQQTAIRLLKLLMISRINEIPLSVIDRLKWDLGLPRDYVQIIHEFPDYFRVAYKDFSARSRRRVLELVCYSSEFGTSVIENKAGNGEKGVPIAFPMQIPKGFVMDKKMQKWVDEWQKLPYISPYENASHLPSKSVESDKWAVAVMHELLHIFVPKKVEKETLLYLGDYLGLRSRFKMALLKHPGIFYLSKKIRPETVVLREGYKRGILIEESPLMKIRSQYIHLMNVKTEDCVPDNASMGSAKKKKLMAREEDYDSSSSEFENAGDKYEEEEDDDDDYEEDENKNMDGASNNVSTTKGRTSRRENLSNKNHERERPVAKRPGYTKEKIAQNYRRDNLNKKYPIREKSVSQHHGNTIDRVAQNDSRRDSFNKYAIRERSVSKAPSYARGKDAQNDSWMNYLSSKHATRERSVSKHCGNTKDKVAQNGFRETEVRSRRFDGSSQVKSSH